MIHCIYHKADLDGKCSAAIVKYMYEKVNLVPFDYGDKISVADFVEGDIIYVVDAVLPIDQMRDFYKRFDLIWIDHHRSAILEMADATEGAINPEGLRDEKRAACELTWEYLFPNVATPKAVKLLADYDCWAWQRDDYKGDRQLVADFQVAMRMLAWEPDDDQWTALLLGGHVDYIATQGAAINRYQQTLMDDVYPNMFVTNWKKYTWLVANCTHTSSSYYHAHPEFNNVDGIIVYFQTAPWEYRYSLRHAGRKSDLDCGALAKSFGGGGHPGAAGMNLEYRLRELKS